MGFFGTEKHRSAEELLFARDQERILGLVSEMARLVESGVSRAVEAIQEGNATEAEAVIADDDAIDAREVAIEQECLLSIALRRPVRDDLRFVFSVIKIATDLERMGDEASNIAERARTLAGRELLRPLERIPKMRDLCISMLQDAVEAFRSRNAQLARDVALRDDDVDALYAEVVTTISALLSANATGDRMERGLELLMTARHLERVGDHATNIAERAYFMITGNRLRQGEES